MTSNKHHIAYIFIPLLWLLLSFTAHAVTISNLPEPDTTPVLDQANVLDTASKSVIERQIIEIKDNTTHDIRLVLVSTISDSHMTPKQFATALFNSWGIGTSDKDNGFLILMVMDERRLEIETGYGLEGDLPDSVLKRIQTDYMVPEFKQGNIGGGLTQGISEVGKRLGVLTHTEGTSSVYDSTEHNSQTALSTPTHYDDVNTHNTHNSGFIGMILLMMYASFLLLLTSLWMAIHWKAYVLLKRVHYASFLDSSFNPVNTYHDNSSVTEVHDYIFWFFFNIVLLFFMPLGIISGLLMLWRIYSKYEASKLSFWKQYPKVDIYHLHHLTHKKFSIFTCILLTICFPFFMLIVYPYLAFLRKKQRTTQRACHACSSSMCLQTEAQENLYLSGQQQKEEEADFADYDVWACSNCSELLVLRYASKEDKTFKKCSKCKKLAYYFNDTEILSYSTTTVHGSEKLTYHCLNCGHSHEKIEKLPLKSVSSDDSSSSDWSSSSDDDSSSWSSSGSDGSSGGGGAGSSW